MIHLLSIDYKLEKNADKEGLFESIIDTPDKRNTITINKKKPVNLNFKL